MCNTFSSATPLIPQHRCLNLVGGKPDQKQPQLAKRTIDLRIFAGDIIQIWILKKLNFKPEYIRI